VIKAKFQISSLPLVAFDNNRKGAGVDFMLPYQNKKIRKPVEFPKSSPSLLV
jgi:hypothetical protein